MAVVELTGVPFDGYGRTGNQALALCCLSLMVVVLAVTSVNIAVPSLQRRPRHRRH